jgi:hypothetical protein
MARCFVLLLCCLTVVACDSPEATRSRGGGPGGDVLNRRAGGVEMHEGSNQFWKTPDVIPAASPSLDSARQAQQLSRQ